MSINPGKTVYPLRSIYSSSDWGVMYPTCTEDISSPSIVIDISGDELEESPSIKYPACIIVAELRRLEKNKVSEVVLTGVNIGDFKDQNHSFGSVIKELDKVSGIERYRISCIEANLITNVVKSEQGKNTVPNNHLFSEVNELVKAGEKIISLLAGNNHPKASEGIETLYVAIVKAMTDSKGNFKTYEKTKFPRVKSSDYMPRINQKVFDLNFGDFRKYKSNI